MCHASRLPVFNARSIPGLSAYAVVARLSIEQPGPGFCHFPADRDYDFFEMLFAEKPIRKFVKDRQRYRNERPCPLDWTPTYQARSRFHELGIAAKA